MQKLLIIDDEEKLRSLMARILSLEGNEVICKKQIDPENALENLFRAQPASNQRLRRLFFCIFSAATNFE